MKIFMATSKKFYPEIKILIEQISRSGLTVFHPYFGFDLDEAEKNPELKERLTLQHFPEIDACDLLFALLPGGYIGISVTIEITYAYARGKHILVSELPNEFAVRAMVNEVCSVEEFLMRMQNT